MCSVHTDQRHVHPSRPEIAATELNRNVRGGHYGQRPSVPHLKAEHMAAPTNAANVKKVLANPEPSTHSTKRTSLVAAHMSAFGDKADIPRPLSGVVRRNPSKLAVAEAVLLQTKFSTRSTEHSQVAQRTSAYLGIWRRECYWATKSKVKPKTKRDSD